ncbi:MAG: hypothetical protein AAGA28_08840 [Pseudomonadota bacterium]
MMTQFRTAIQRSRDTLLADFVGAAALVVVLFGGLYFPGFV